MISTKKDIIGQLREHILFLQGFKKTSDRSVNINLSSIDPSFPQGCFPLASVHEFLTDKTDNIPATYGFIIHIISQLMKSSGICIWIGTTQTVFPPGLRYFGIDPGNIVFIQVKDQRERLWVMEEALKCEGLAAVVGELKELGFAESRRFQLAVEKSRVTGFIIRHNTANPNVNVCVSRWKISPLSSSSLNGLPGIGFPRWHIELLKIRNGKPGSWQMEYSGGMLRPAEIIQSVSSKAEIRKVV